jgi:hypothetical protein
MRVSVSWRIPNSALSCITCITTNRNLIVRQHTATVTTGWISATTPTAGSLSLADQTTVTRGVKTRDFLPWLICFPRLSTPRWTRRIGFLRVVPWRRSNDRSRSSIRPSLIKLWQCLRLFRSGRLSYDGGFVDLVSGRMLNLAVDPAVWQRFGADNQRKNATRSNGRAYAVMPGRRL